MAFADNLRKLAKLIKECDASLTNFAKTGDDRVVTTLVATKLEYLALNHGVKQRLYMNS